MVLKIKLDDNFCKKDIPCHMLPCNIQLNGYCKVSKYFNPYIREDKNSLISSIRGYPLQGQKVEVPKGYTGVILRENNDPESDERELKATGTFKEFVSWNWDKNPASEDKLNKAFQWINVTSVLHKPLSQNESLSTKSPQKQRKRKLTD